MTFTPFSHHQVDSNPVSYAIGQSQEKMGSYYCLCMFPYPSGDLHIGHVRNYTIGDVVARHKRLQGYDVLHPMGWDAFGLPAENAAIAHQLHPAKWTRANIERMKAQLQALSLSYDWECEFATIDPEYYGLQQKLFLKMYDKGLVYRKKSVVNWDPVDETVLANEQVIDGKGWRSGALVEQKEINQWYLKITDYADRLLDDLDQLNEWPDKVVQMQRNWIGRSQGVLVTFDVQGHDSIQVFTTRPDTLFGVSCIVVAIDHPLALEAAKNNAEIKAYIDHCQQTGNAEEDLAQREKTGCALPFEAVCGLTGKSHPVWVANYVLMGYGTGAVMSVPAHDERDFEFANKYELPIIQVIENDESLPVTTPGTLVNSGEFSGLSSDEARIAIIKKLEALNYGEAKTNYRLRDWGISRQRYWGCPIPMIHCKTCGIVPEAEENLPVVLPIDIDFGDGKNVLKKLSSFTQTHCPKCGGEAHRETDTFDTFFDSSWYFDRFPSHGYDDILDPKGNFHLPIDLYVGGIEHAILHLLYARFIHKVLHDFEYVKKQEPFKRLLTQGMVLKDGVKMSKSKGNVVAPSQLLETFGVDATRMFICFAAPPEQSIEWSDGGVGGSHRFLSRLWKEVHENKGVYQTMPSLDKALEFPEGMAILWQIQQDFEKIQLNTVVSGIMKLFNWLSTLSDSQEAQSWYMRQLLLNLYTVAPNTSSALLETICQGHTQQLTLARIDQSWGEQDTVNVVVQIKGKKRGQVCVAKDADQDEVLAQALKDEGINKHVGDKPIRKVIYVAGRLLNIVV